MSIAIHHKIPQICSIWDVENMCKGFVFIQSSVVETGLNPLSCSLTRFPQEMIDS
jgi:hypothetical protein